MSDPVAHQYEFADFHLDLAERQLLREGKTISLPPKVFDTLVILVQNSGRLLDKERLMRELWPDTFVEEVNLSVNISALRKALGESEGQRFIDTVPKRGYRFVADVREIGGVRPDLVVHSHVTGRMVTQEFSGPVTKPQNLSEPSSPARQGQVLAAIVIGAGLVATAVYLGVSKWTRFAAAKSATVNSLAVLPFQTSDRTSDNDYLELGIADDLINKLTAVKHVNVRPTATIRKYLRANQDPIAAGKELNVDAVLQGSMQSSGNSLRLAVVLLRVSDGKKLWSDNFDQPSHDVLTMETSISQRVLEVIAPNLTVQEREILTKPFAVNSEAHEAYLRGRYFWNKRTGDGLKKATEFFQQAIDLDHSYALAYAGLSDCYTLLYDRRYASADSSVPQAKLAAAKAIELDDTLAEAHTSLAYVDWVYDRNRTDSEKEFRRAIDLDPHYATARQWYGRFLGAVGRFDEAIKQMQLAITDDPVSLIINSNLGSLFYYAKDYTRAEAQFQKTLELEPNFIQTHWELGNTYEREQLYDKAYREFKKALELQQEPKLAAQFEDAYKRSGFASAVKVLIGQWSKDVALAHDPQGRGLEHTIARSYAEIGEKEQAINWLQKASADHHPWLTYLNVDPQFDSLHGDPRFAELLKREGL